MNAFVNGFVTGQVNGQLVRARRLAAGLTPQELADRIGLTSELLWAIERGTSDDLQHVPLLAILGLAEALDFRPGELLDPPAREASDASTSESPMAQPDEVKLEAALLQYGAAITRDDLASAFGWTLQRVEVAPARTRPPTADDREPSAASQLEQLHHQARATCPRRERAGCAAAGQCRADPAEPRRRGSATPPWPAPGRWSPSMWPTSPRP